MREKYAVISGFLGRMQDRFHTHYGENRSIEEKFALASTIEGIKGLELVYPYDCPDTGLIKELMTKHNLEISAINLNVKADPLFRDGSYSSPHKDVQKLAMEFTEGAIKAAEELGANLVTCCPLADGYDYAFQSDYREDWKRLREGIRQAAAMNSRVKFSVEYKPTEPRVRCYLDTAASSLTLCNDIGVDNLGVTLDVGHALCAQESPAQAVSLLGEYGRLFYVHVNDNNRSWDWDLIPGSEHLWALVEFLVYLKRYDHAGWFTADMMPARIDVVKGFSQTYRVMEKLQGLADKIDLDEIHQLNHQGDVTDAFDHLWNLI